MEQETLETSVIKKPWNPVEVRFGIGMADRLADVVKNLGHDNVFFVTDRFILEKTEMAAHLVKVLNDNGIKKVVWADVQPEPKLEVAEAIVQAVKNGSFDCVVGLGGGSVLDMAKVAAAMATHDGDVKNYLGANKFQKDGLNLILIPTTAGTGSEVTNRSMVTTDEKAVFASNALYAKVAIVDPKLTVTMPPRVTADTGFDALCHSIEGIMSGEKFEGVEEVENTGYEAVKLILDNIKEAVMNGANLEARRNMMLAATLSGLVLSRKAMVYGHSMAYPFAPRYKVSHGRSTIMALPYVMEFSCQNEECRSKVAKIADVLGLGKAGQSDKEKAAEVIVLIKNLVDEIYAYLNTPITLQGIGVPKEDLGWMAKLCLERWPRPASPVQATDKDILALYEKMWEGRL